jgi:hypothetical protein
MAFKFSLGFAGASSGKNIKTGSSTVSNPSCTAKPIAVEVKLFLSDWSGWGDWGP